MVNGNGPSKVSKEEYAISLNGKYAKRALERMEQYLQVDKLDPEIRKILLDSFADCAREQRKVLSQDTVNTKLDSSN